MMTRKLTDLQLECIFENRIFIDLSSLVVTVNDETGQVKLMCASIKLFSRFNSKVFSRPAFSSALHTILPKWRDYISNVLGTEKDFDSTELLRLNFLVIPTASIVLRMAVPRFQLLKILLNQGWAIIFNNFYKKNPRNKDAKYLVIQTASFMNDENALVSIEEQCELIPGLIPLIEYKGIPQANLRFHPLQNDRDLYESSPMSISELAIDFAINKVPQRTDGEKLIKTINESKMLVAIVEFVEYNFKDFRSVQRALVGISSYAKWSGPEGVPVALTMIIVTKLTELILSSTGGKKSKNNSNLDKYDLIVEVPEIVISLLKSFRSKCAIRDMNREHEIVRIFLQFLASNKDRLIYEEFVINFIFSLDSQTKTLPTWLSISHRSTSILKE